MNSVESCVREYSLVVVLNQVLSDLEGLDLGVLQESTS